MTKQERWNLYENGQFRQSIGIELFDWAGYWATAGLDPIEDETQKNQTRQAIHLILENPSFVIGVVTGLAISDDAVISAEVITDAIIHSVVVSIMANKLEWVTGVAPTESPVLPVE